MVSRALRPHSLKHIPLKRAYLHEWGLIYNCGLYCCHCPSALWCSSGWFEGLRDHKYLAFDCKVSVHRIWEIGIFFIWITKWSEKAFSRYNAGWPKGPSEIGIWYLQKEFPDPKCSLSKIKERQDYMVNLGLLKSAWTQLLSRKQDSTAGWGGMWSGCIGQVQPDNNNSESSESIGIPAKGEVGEETLWNTPAEGDTDLAVTFQKNSAEHSRPPSPIIFHWPSRPEVPPLTLKLFSAQLPRITIRCFFLYVVFISVLLSVPLLIPLPALHGTSNIFELPAL